MGKYISLKEKNGYEYVTRNIGKEGAVVIIPKYYNENGEVELQLILSNRPTFDKPILEFPAGLIDKDGESIWDTAVRELEEETGWYNVQVIKDNILSQHPSPSSAGLSDEVLYIVEVIITEDSIPKFQRLDEEEKITVLPLMSINKINEYIAKNINNIYVSSRLVTYIIGLHNRM